MAQRIKDLPAATATNADDFFVVDGVTSGARSYPARYLASARATISDTSGSIELDPTALNADFIEITETLTGNLTLTMATTNQTARLVQVYMSGTRGANTLKIAGLVAPAATEIEMDDGDTVLLYVAPGVGTYGVKLNTGGAGSDATVAWTDVELSADTDITVAAHALLRDSSGDIIRGEVVIDASGGDVDLKMPDAPGDTASWVFRRKDALNTVRVIRDSSGTINNSTAVTIAARAGAAVQVKASSAVDSACVYYADGDIAGDATVYGATDFNGNPTSGNLFVKVTRGASSSQPAAADSGKRILTDGAWTIPTIEGWWATVVLGGDHDPSFNSTTLDVSAQSWGTGDKLLVEVTSTTTVEITRVAAASVVDESDFA